MIGRTPPGEIPTNTPLCLSAPSVVQSLLLVYATESACQACVRRTAHSTNTPLCLSVHSVVHLFFFPIPRKAQSKLASRANPTNTPLCLSVPSVVQLLLCASAKGLTR